MPYTLQQFRDLVRAQLDTDADDLPDVLVDSWVREGWRFCVNRHRRWPFYETVWPLPVTAGVGVYDERGLGDNGGGVPIEIDAVHDDNGVPLSWIGFNQAGTLGVSGGPTRFWSRNAGQLYLFPAPETSTNFAAYGSRESYDWVGDGGEATSDLPPEFDDVVLNWVLGRAFQRQEDGDLGVMHLDQAEVLLRQLQRRWMRYMSSAPLVLNGGVPRHGERLVVWDV
jgi:hypothetical protein